MTPKPDIGSWADSVYAEMEPLTWDDESQDWALAIMCGGIGVMFQTVQDLAGTGENGEVGWSIIVDVNRAPDAALPWLAQFVGVKLVPGSTPDEQRIRIISTDGWWRGTLNALLSQVAATLTGSKSVVFRERDQGNAYYLTVITQANETPDPAATLAALLAQKPAGIVLDFRTSTGQDYITVRTAFNTYAEVKAAYANYNTLKLDEPL